MTGTNRRRTLLALAAGALAAGVAACGGGGDEPGPAMTVGTDGLSTFDTTALGSALSTYPLQDLSSAEAAGLAFMREEEMLAYTVYARSALLWPSQPIFGNIAASEATHTAAVKALLDRYGLPDPLAGLAMGTLVTAEFIALQTALEAASRVSLLAALQVGAQIEELDISDLKPRTAQTDNADIRLVYDNLARGSRNHLRSFIRTLTNLGGSYVPRYLSADEFTAIVNSPMENGR